MVCLFFYLHGYSVLLISCFLPLTLTCVFYQPFPISFFPMASFPARNPVPQSPYRYMIFCNTLVPVFPIGSNINYSSACNQKSQLSAFAEAGFDYVVCPMVVIACYE